MKLSRFRILGIIFIFGMIGILSAVFMNSLDSNVNQQTYNGLPLCSSSPLWLYSTETPEEAIGISDYVFVAKINKILRTEHKEVTTNKDVSIPYTIYEVEVVENIKGELDTTEPIELKQYGGLQEDGKSYMFFEGGSLLNIGEYYILMANTWAQTEGETISTGDPNKIIALGANYNPLARNSTVSQYKLAYENEEIPEPLVDIDKPLSKYDINYSK